MSNPLHGGVREHAANAEELDTEEYFSQPCFQNAYIIYKHNIIHL